MLETRDLCCQRGDRRLFEDLTLRLDPGRLLLVEGSNGAGKTSLLRLLAGLSLPRSGEVRWCGRTLREQREAFASALCYLGHGAALKDDLTPVENLCADAALAGHPVSSDQVRAGLRHWGLSRAVGLPVRVLSAGQRRRVALARLRLTPAPLWILDEPFNALDTHAVRQLSQQLSQHLLDDGMVVLTSHQDLPIDPARVDRLRLGT